MLQPGAQPAGEDSGGAGGSSDIAAIAGGGGNRWPRQETMALLKIRSDMDAVFRDSSLKGPLWEEVSRKMAEMGYRRSAKKCREKFENVYKYHKRTKDTRAAKGPDKTYRFFDQLQALDTSGGGQTSSSFPPPGSPPVESAVPIAMAMPPPRQPPPPPPPPITATTTAPSSAPFQVVMPAPPVQPPGATTTTTTTTTPSSSFSTSSDEGVAEMRTRRRKKRKRKWIELLERLTESVAEKQEEMQRKFLEAMEKRENERRIREEAWKAQESARVQREHEILVQERSMATAKDAALVSFLQRLSENQQIPLPPVILRPPSTLTEPVSQAPLTPVTQMTGVSGAMVVHTMAGTSSSRWPKEEVEALIKLRMGMEQKYQEGGPKGPLWEEMSTEMRRLGYERSAKRCKEKWENINKYFKKVKDGKRRDKSKTCPYYHQLEAIYRAKSNLSPAALPPPAAPPRDPGSSNAGNDDNDKELYDEDGDEDEDDQASG